MINIVEGDCLDVLKRIKSDTIDLIITSPPYADARKKEYGGVSPNKYGEWFLPRSAEFLRVLKPSGSFVLNIKEKCENGERSTYVYELVLSLKKQGWFWIEEYMWHKTNPMCGKWKNRFKDGFERCYHFTKSLDFKMNQESVKIPVKPSTIKRSANLNNTTDAMRLASTTGSHFAINKTHYVGKKFVFPDNVLVFSCETQNKQHPAVYPKKLPEWFVKLFTDENDSVLDPFVGSGTTGVVCKQLNRNFIGIDINQKYCDLARSRIKNET